MPPKVRSSAKVPRPRSGVLRQKAQGRIDGTRSGSVLPQFRASTPLRSPTPARSQTPITTKRRCANPTCPDPKVQQTPEGSLVCLTCGTVAEADTQLVAEQQFNEGKGGRITAQGQTVGHDQTHQRTYGQPPGSGKADQRPPASHGQALATARDAMQRYLAPLNIPMSEIEPALAIWNYVYEQRFVQGRGLVNAATACLFLSIRRRSEQVQGQLKPKYPVMLIDFAEIANVDVFALGRMYTDLVKLMYLDTSTGKFGPQVLDLYAHGPEVLVERFVEALEFPREVVRKIKDDAIRIVRRMNRDWMNIGRRPAGVCGAAVILAARMNNHRRTTREVVLTAKVTEITLNKRLEEFSDLKSSQLSINDFRNAQLLNAIESADPPAYTRAHQPPKPKRKRRGRPSKQVPETAADIEDDSADAEFQEGQRPTKRARVDAEGFAIPDLPQRPSADETSSTQATSPGPRKAPGRPPGSKNKPPPPVSPAEQAIEDEIQRDIDQTLLENPELDPTPIMEPLEGDELPPSVRARLTQIRALSRQKGNTNTISLNPEIAKDEFEDDEEVAICLLTEAERRMKEIVWVQANADWLRKEHTKKIRHELKVAELIAKGMDPATLEKSKKKDGRRKDGRMRAGQAGDIRYLQNQDGRKKPQGTVGGEVEIEGEEGEEGAEGSEREGSRTRSPSESPFPAMASAAGSVRMFLSHRQNAFASRRLNAAAIEEVYTFRRDSSSTPSDSRSTTQAGGSSGSVDHSQVIFGAIGSKESGLMRSKSSHAAERRERKKKELTSREGSAVGPSDRTGSGSSVSTSPEAESDRERSGSAVSEEASPTAAPGFEFQGQPKERSQQHTPTSAQMDDGSVEEVVGSNPVSRNQSDTPGPGDGLISLREDLDMDDEEDDDDDDEDEEEEDNDDEDEAEPDLDDVFAGRAGSVRR